MGQRLVGGARPSGHSTSAAKMRKSILITRNNIAFRRSSNPPPPFERAVARGAGPSPVTLRAAGKQCDGWMQVEILSPFTATSHGAQLSVTCP
jgi:hypothetical protein